MVFVVVVVVVEAPDVPGKESKGKIELWNYRKSNFSVVGMGCGAGSFFHIFLAKSLISLQCSPGKREVW